MLQFFLFRINVDLFSQLHLGKREVELNQVNQTQDNLKKKCFK
jgi:hypothetical protein